MCRQNATAETQRETDVTRKQLVETEALPVSPDNVPIGRVTVELVRCSDGSVGMQWERAGWRIGFTLGHGAQQWAEQMARETAPAQDDVGPIVRVPIVRKSLVQVRRPARTRKQKT